MRVLFYQLSRDRAETLLPKLAPRVLDGGERLLVVSADEAQRRAIAEALWSAGPETFLANGHAGEPHAERQPILLADTVERANGATALALVDGEWREPGEGFARVFYLFDDRTIDAARRVWVDVRAREGVDKEFWKQEGGRWTRAA